MKKPSKPKTPPMTKLPKTFQGVPVIRGKGYQFDTIDKLIERRASLDDEWPLGEFFVVTANGKDEFDLRDGKVFSNREAAVKYARSCGNGNVDHRVLRCTSEVLVVATENDL